MSNSSPTFGGEGWPASDVPEGHENRKSRNESLPDLADPLQERVENQQINWHTVDTAGSQDVPLTSRQFDRWLIKQDKTVWPDRLLETAERARLALQGTEQGVGQDPGIQAVARRDLYAFTRAHAEWKR